MLLASLLVDSIQISQDHFLDCKSWLGLCGNGRDSVLYQLEMAVADFGGFENSHRYWFLESLHWQRRERKEERLWLKSLSLPSNKDNHIYVSSVTEFF